MAGRFIDKLKKAARLEPVKKEIILDSGEEVVMYVTPLTAAERERAKKTPAPMTLERLPPAVDPQSPQRQRPTLFTPGDAAVLKNEVRDSDLQKLMLAVLGADEEEDLDMKSSSEGAED